MTFVERIELVLYVEGGDENPDHIRPIVVTTAPAVQKTVQKPTTTTQRVHTADPRLEEIYAMERTIVNHNSMLRGIKPTDFSGVRKQAEEFIARLRAAGKVPAVVQTGRGDQRGRQQQQGKKRRLDPIIMLSPSASALLTMGNIKAFLEEGTFIPPTESMGEAPNFLRVSRLLPSIHPTTPIRFDVVDNPEKFKPEYWEKLVAVFTTGQEWQFRGYKWSQPSELFREVRGFYVGWEGERVPESVGRWGTGVQVLSVERGRRFRDREVCEKFWEGVERWMRIKGWGR